MRICTERVGWIIRVLYRNVNKFWSNSFLWNRNLTFFPSCRREQTACSELHSQTVWKSWGTSRENLSMCCSFAHGLWGFGFLCCELTARHLKLGKLREGARVCPCLGRASSCIGAGMQQRDAAWMWLRLQWDPESYSPMKHGSWLWYQLAMFKSCFSDILNTPNFNDDKMYMTSASLNIWPFILSDIFLLPTVKWRDWNCCSFLPSPIPSG